MNNLLQKIKNKLTKEKYYATSKYIYKKKIEKVNDKGYRIVIIKKIIKHKEIIKISNDIFRYLLIKFENIECFDSTKNYLLQSKDGIITFLDKQLEKENDKEDYYISLSEILIYFFERISLLYLKLFSKKKESFIEEKENLRHLYVFKECNKFLSELNKNEIDEGLNANITKLFCYTFIKMHNKRRFKPENVIKIINESDEIKMVKLYIYKTIYNQNKKQMNTFLDSDIIDKYKLYNYQGFEEFIKSKDIEKLENSSFGDNKSNDIYLKFLKKIVKTNLKKK